MDIMISGLGNGKVCAKAMVNSLFESLLKAVVTKLSRTADFIGSC